MRLLHLADLHLGKRVNGFDMLEDQRDILAKILAVCDEHGVEAVAMAGDLYDTPLPPAGAVLLLDWFLNQLAGRGIAVLAIAGNHDSAERLDYAAALLARQRVYFAGRFTGRVPVIELRDEFGPIECCLLPFVRAATVRHLLPDAPITDYDSAVGAALATLPARRPGMRRVLLAHQTVVAGSALPEAGGSESIAADLDAVRGGINIGTVEAVRAEQFAANGGFSYVALGHIHRPQRASGETIRYAGSPLCYSLDECGTVKCALLVTLGAQDDALTVTPLPLTPRRAMRHLTGPLAKLTDPATVTGPQDYIWATLTDDTPQPDAMAVLRAAYPNAMRLDYAPRPGAGDPGLPAAEALRGKSFAELFDDFFTRLHGRPLTEAERAALDDWQKEASEA